MMAEQMQNDMFGGGGRPGGGMGMGGGGGGELPFGADPG